MVLHHVNEDRTDDRLENLECLTKAEHLAVHREDHAAKRREGLLRAWKRRKADTHAKSPS
jgi:hypothetical protein